jgi:hypothetical protein
MSDSMSKTEIEDVLSSIRRLVTEDHRPLQQPSSPSSDKLVLTPALRIGPALSGGRQPFGAAEPLRLVAAQKVSPAPALTHHAAAALEAALKDRRDDWEPDGTEVSPADNWSVEWNAADGDETEAPVPAEPGTALATAADHPSVPAVISAAREDDITPEDDIWDDFLAEHRTAPLLSAGQADPWRQAKGQAGDPPSGPPGHAATADEIDPVPAADSGPHTALSGLDPTDSPSGIDEALLRDLIRDVLREELQGDLGERITRNVRKLVRAEIARALTARDLI